jgi:DNA-directed RNA polymerase subunit alpha
MTNAERCHRLMTRLDTIWLSTRTRNCLKCENIIYVGDLVQKTEAEMLRIPNLGRKSLRELKEMLAQMGLHFGMEVPDWPFDHNGLPDWAQANGINQE